MNSIVVHYQEIALKGNNRPWFVARLARNLRTATRDAGVHEVRGRGLLLGAVVDGQAGEIVEACRERGLLVLTAGDDVVRLAPPLTISSVDVEEALAILSSVLATPLS